MDTSRFDILTRLFARKIDRRAALTAAGAGLATGLASQIGMASAQEATPAAAGENPAFLFVQAATSGTFTANPEAGTPAVDGTPVAGGGADYLLTLEEHNGGTIYFSDRPERVFGDAPTKDFLAGFGFSPANPPNAALVTQTDDGTEDVVVLELLDPKFDETAGTLTYGATILSQYEGEGLAFVAARQADTQLPETFGRSSLFIDDCADATPLYCATESGRDLVVHGDLSTRGMCWSFLQWCQPCSGGWDGTAAECNQRFPACNGECITTR